ncbi:AfsR/SARP family transcriptional regulator [Rhodococcus sp. 2H158]
MSSPGVALGVLGGFAATVDGRPIDLGGIRQRALLAALVVAFPGDVSGERLLEQVWHDVDDPKTSSLHFAVSKLRDRLSPQRPRGDEGVIVREGSRYRLAVAAEQIDAVRFADLVARGDRLREQGAAQAAAEAYATALSCWRGSPYADVADAEFVRPEVARLTAIELRTRKALLQIRLDQGGSDDVVEAAERLVAAHPLDERAWELLVVALYRAGRQADALAALRRVRTVLDGELGIEPGTGLRELETAVLRQDDVRLLGTAGVSPAPAAALGTRSATSNVPSPRTALVDRARELADVGAALAGERLVTLVGPGGVGKTRLAVEVCRNGGERPADGPWFVDLAAVRADALVAATVASALQILGPGTVDHLATVLAPRECVLVLDNCEHLLDGSAELVTALLERCPGVRILATSREPLGLDGEWVYEVPPLDECAAVELFGVRAAGVVPGWTIHDEVTEAVRRICTELDGIPLGIELAAAQLRVLSEQQIAEGLSDRFALLQGGSRTAPPRQRGLADAIEWSYRLLDDEQARLLREVAVFAGSFDIEGAAAVHGSTPPLSVLPPLTALVRRSLLRVEPSSSPRRYSMLQTIREFALARADAAERDRMADVHRRFVLRRALAAVPHLRGSRARQTFDALTADIAEHRAAAASALAAGDPVYALELAGALYWFWYRRGHIREGLELISAALDAVERTGTAVAAATLSSALTGLGGLTYLAGDAAGAAVVLGRSADAAGRGGDVVTEAWMRSWWAYCSAITGPSDEFLHTAHESADVLRREGAVWQRADALLIEGMILRFLDHPQRAQQVLREAVATAERCGHGWAVGSASWTLMRTAMDVGDTDGALDAVRVMQPVLEAERDVTSWLVLVHSAAALVARLGTPDVGAMLLGAVRALGSRIGFLPEVMDPVDGPREAAVVRDALGDAEFERCASLGAGLDRDEVSALLVRLCRTGHVGAQPELSGS